MVASPAVPTRLTDIVIQILIRHPAVKPLRRASRRRGKVLTRLIPPPPEVTEYPDGITPIDRSALLLRRLTSFFRTGRHIGGITQLEHLSDVIILLDDIVFLECPDEALSPLFTGLFHMNLILNHREKILYLNSSDYCSKISEI